MPEYRRAFAPGATFFFTVVVNFRRPILCSPMAVSALRKALAEIRARHPFEIEAAAILPDHMHCLWTLPRADTNFSARWRLIKARFTRLYLQGGGTETGRSSSRRRQGERGVWQRRFWEHVIRDERDLEQHMDYVHYNPVKHGLVRCPHDWVYSTFRRWVQRGAYPPDWGCVCAGRRSKDMDFGEIEDRAGEPA